MRNRIIIVVAGLLVGTMGVQAQLTWDPALDAGVTGGAGTWDNATANWWDGASDVSWINSANATFGGSGGLVTIATGSAITVNDITLNPGVGKYTFMAQTDNQGISVDPGATWTLNDNELEFVGNTVNDTKLTMTSVGTLTVTGSGVFDTGEKHNGANWVAAGSTLDVQGSLTMRGHVGTVGQFGTVKMADGTTYIHERNGDQGYFNDWELSGAVTFDNRWSRFMNLNGVISDGTTPGQLVASNLGGKFVKLGNLGNTFSGGIVVDSGSTRSEVQNTVGDAAFGAVPGAFDADNITLRNGGELKMQGVTINANRGITLDNGGIIVNTGAANSYSGTITGTGGLQIGRAAGGDGNKFILNSATSDYTGETRIYQGSLQLGVSDALPSGSVLHVGGKGNSILEMEGYDLETAGLQSSGSNTRRIDNDGATESTLTINVADGESYTYGANLAGASAIHIVKTGAGTQRFVKDANTTDPASITVDGGLLVWNSNDGATTTVGTGGTLGGSGTFNGAVTVAGNLAPGESPGTMTFNDALTLESTATTTLEITGTGAGLFDILLNDGGDTLTADGILAFDTTGYSAVLDDTITVFENWGGFSGGFDDITGIELGGGLSFDTSTLLSDGTVTVIPEPATLGMVVAMGGGLLWIRRIFMV